MSKKKNEIEVVENGDEGEREHSDVENAAITMDGENAARQRELRRCNGR
ncbi:hypothetical protein A2U01_0007892 [Trifolium medium]|uniref:Uncharacterized protein n=1 Tax=Trifolium medium TaxID=97028 RepID=A0A392MJX8_9FABA|nr:hypothetical protein [Trifolium medium]